GRGGGEFGHPGRGSRPRVGRSPGTPAASSLPWSCRSLPASGLLEAARHSTAAGLLGACILTDREMEPHHVVEAVGIVVLGLVFYSYARRWFEAAERSARPARAP